jgi:hypothetical protein
MLLLELHAPINTFEIQVRSRHINRKRHTDSNPWMTPLQINLIARYNQYERVIFSFEKLIYA